MLLLLPLQCASSMGPTTTIDPTQVSQANVDVELLILMILASG
jgi:hypothetical protein